MEELLRKLRLLSKDDVIKEICGDRVFMNNKNTQVQLPYISYNPVITGKALGHYGVGSTEYLADKYVSQVNLYCGNSYDFTKVYNAIKKVMKEHGFKMETEYIDSLDDRTWICLRFSIRIY